MYTLRERSNKGTLGKLASKRSHSNRKYTGLLSVRPGQLLMGLNFDDKLWQELRCGCEHCNKCHEILVASVSLCTTKNLALSKGITELSFTIRSISAAAHDKIQAKRPSVQ